MPSAATAGRDLVGDPDRVRCVPAVHGGFLRHASFHPDLGLIRPGPRPHLGVVARWCQCGEHRRVRCGHPIEQQVIARAPWLSDRLDALARRNPLRDDFGQRFHTVPRCHARSPRFHPGHDGTGILSNPWSATISRKRTASVRRCVWGSYGSSAGDEAASVDIGGTETPACGRPRNARLTCEAT